MEKQTKEQVVQQWDAFIRSAESANIVDDAYNGGIFAEYVRENNGGIVSFSFLSQAARDPQVLDRLHLKTGRWTAEQIAAEAAEEKAANESARLMQIAADWVRDECPLGLLAGSDL